MTNKDRENSVSDLCSIHQHHDHQHGDTCGCKAIKHGDHVDYVHDGRGHRIHGNPLEDEDLKEGSQEDTAPEASLD